MTKPKPEKRKLGCRPNRRLKAALRTCRDEGFPIRAAHIGPDGEVEIVFGSRSDPVPGADPAFKHARDEFGS